METNTVIAILEDCLQRQGKNDKIETTITYKNISITGKLPQDYLVDDSIVKLENGDNCSYIPVDEIAKVGCAEKSEAPRIVF